MCLMAHSVQWRIPLRTFLLQIIKNLARVLATDPDVLFRLSSSTDPDIVTLLKDRSKVLELLRLIMDKGLADEQLDQIMDLIACDAVSDIPLATRDNCLP